MPEVIVRCCLRLFFILFFRQSLALHLEFTDLASLTGKWAPNICSFPLNSHPQVPRLQTLPCLAFKGDLNPGPHACPMGTLPTVPSPQAICPLCLSSFMFSFLSCSNFTFKWWASCQVRCQTVETRGKRPLHKTTASHTACCSWACGRDRLRQEQKEPWLQLPPTHELAFIICLCITRKKNLVWKLPEKLSC